MHVDPILNSLRATLAGQLALAGSDPVVENVSTLLLDALEPALRHAAMEIAQQAATEIGAQLTDRHVDVLLVDDDIELRVVEIASTAAGTSGDDPEDLAARITLRLPPSLKQLVEQVASGDGESVNSFVVDALSRRTNRSTRRGANVTEGFDL